MLVYLIRLYKTREKFEVVSTHLQTQRRELKRSYVFYELQSVWKCEETLSRVLTVFDVSSLSKLKQRTKRRNKS